MTSNNSVIGNYIGTDISGGTRDANTFGMEDYGSGNTIGGTSAAQAMSSPAIAQAWPSSDVVPGRGQPDRHQCGRHRSLWLTATGIDVGTGGRHDRRDLGRRRQCHLRQRHDGIDIDASCLVEGNLIGTNAAGTAALANTMTAFMSTRREPRSAGPRPARAMSSPATAATASTSTLVPGRGQLDRHQCGRHRRGGERRRWH